MRTSKLRGVQVVISYEYDLGDNRRKHKKKRINKKWRKRYGVHDDGLRRLEVIVSDHIMYMSRRTYTILKAINFFTTAPHHGNNFLRVDHYHSDHYEGLKKSLDL